MPVCVRYVDPFVLGISSIGRLRQPERQQAFGQGGAQLAQRGFEADFLAALALAQGSSHIDVRNQIDIKVLPCLPITGNLQNCRTAKAFVAKQKIFVKSDGCFAVAGADAYWQGDAGERIQAVIAPVFKAQWYERSLWRDNAVAELFGQLITPGRGADGRGGEAAGGDDKVAAAEVSGGCAQLESCFVRGGCL